MFAMRRSHSMFENSALISTSLQRAYLFREYLRSFAIRGRVCEFHNLNLISKIEIISFGGTVDEQQYDPITE